MHLRKTGLGEKLNQLQLEENYCTVVLQRSLSCADLCALTSGALYAEMLKVESAKQQE